MKTSSLLLFLSFATATACASSDRELTSAAAEQVQARPNIILISADDLGWGELGCYGQEWIKTPAVDRLAREGMRFLDFYSGAPVCAPARAMLMTGKHSGQSFVRDNGNPGERGKPRPEDLHFPGQFPLPDAEVTLAEALQAEGYTTAGYGKWGLGFEGSSGDPLLQGFDHFGGYLCQVHAHNHHPRFLWLDGEKQMLEGNERGATGAVHSQDWFVDRALEFVRDQDESDDPFFLYLPFAVPHLAIQANQDIVDEYAALMPEEDHKHRGYIKHPTPRAGYAAMITQMDRGIGALMELLEEMNLADDTIVIFTSDNGPTYDRLGGSDSAFFESAGPFRGYKGDVLEGGIRVPLVVRWPGRVAAGSSSNLPAAWWDLFPTLTDLAGAQTPEACNGISIAPTLLASGEQTQREALYWEFPAYGGQLALRAGSWKLVRHNLKKDAAQWTLELYNLDEDPGEANNVADANPEIVDRLLARAAEERVPSEIFPFPALDSGAGFQR